MSDYTKKSWYPSPEDEQMLDEIKVELSLRGDTAAIRHCIRLVYKRMFKRTKPKQHFLNNQEPEPEPQEAQ